MISDFLNFRWYESGYLPPGFSCQEALKPFPVAAAPVSKRTTAELPVVETRSGFWADLETHSWASLGEKKSGPP